jgi:hypothetical protein
LPRYDTGQLGTASGLETETYQLNAELAPVANPRRLP